MSRIIILSAALSILATGCLPEGGGASPEEDVVQQYDLGDDMNPGPTSWREVAVSDRYAQADGSACDGEWDEGCVDCLNVETGEYRRYVIQDHPDLGVTWMGGQMDVLDIDYIEVLEDGSIDPAWAVYSPDAPNGDVAVTVMGCYPAEYIDQGR